LTSYFFDFKPDYFMMLFNVPGERSSFGFPAKVTRPGFADVLKTEVSERDQNSFFQVSGQIFPTAGSSYGCWLLGDIYPELWKELFFQASFWRIKVPLSISAST
jgi:hypothetical protein